MLALFVFFVSWPGRHPVEILTVGLFSGVLDTGLFQSVENCVCILRNLSYHVHKEVPEAERYQEPMAGLKPGAAGSQKKKKKDDAGCFGGKKVKGQCPPFQELSIIYSACWGRWMAAPPHKLVYWPLH